MKCSQERTVWYIADPEKLNEALIKANRALQLADEVTNLVDDITNLVNEIREIDGIFYSETKMGEMKCD